MKSMKQFAIILMFSFIGEALHALIPLPVPASIYGIILLFLALERKWIELRDIHGIVVFLIQIMPILFVPAAVGLIKSWPILKPAIVPYLVITVLSTIAVMAVTGRVTQMILRLGGDGQEKQYIRK
ncbi:MAG: CidA/LrgA family protein [Schwartzia sp.]|nr:CidA/LrgA family protein [Schwartzia sp. (in: firmicutes)]